MLIQITIVEINLNEKRKKGRPKKNFQIILNESNYTLTSDIHNIEAMINVDNANVTHDKEDKKRRGRKKKQVVEDEIKIKKNES